MIRIFAILLLFGLHQTAWTQVEIDSLNNEIVTFELVGNWKNMTFALEEKLTPGYKKDIGIGSVSESRMGIPMKTSDNNELLRINADGNLISLKYTNAKWKLDGNHFVVTTEFGTQFNGLVTKDASTKTYLLTFNGETYKKY